jgi:hypothetical protein
MSFRGSSVLSGSLFSAPCRCRFIMFGTAQVPQVSVSERDRERARARASEEEGRTREREREKDRERWRDRERRRDSERERERERKREIIRNKRVTLLRTDFIEKISILPSSSTCTMPGTVRSSHPTSFYHIPHLCPYMCRIKRPLLHMPQIFPYICPIHVRRSLTHALSSLATSEPFFTFFPYMSLPISHIYPSTCAIYVCSSLANALSSRPNSKLLKCCGKCSSVACLR